MVQNYGKWVTILSLPPLLPPSDYDLQATMVECCISALRESGGRSSHAHRWFSDHTLISAFMNIHETTFETVSDTYFCNLVHKFDREMFVNCM